MALTDVQIYEQHPDIAALSDEYVTLGKQIPELTNRVTATGEALTEAETAQRGAVRVATEAVQAAQKALAKVRAEQALAVQKAKTALDEATAESARVTARRKQVQAQHNAMIEAVQAAHAASDDETEE